MQQPKYDTLWINNGQISVWKIEITSIVPCFAVLAMRMCLSLIAKNVGKNKDIIVNQNTYTVTYCRIFDNRKQLIVQSGGCKSIFYHIRRRELTFLTPPLWTSRAPLGGAPSSLRTTGLDQDVGRLCFTFRFFRISVKVTLCCLFPFTTVRKNTSRHLHEHGLWWSESTNFLLILCVSLETIPWLHEGEKCLTYST